MGPDELTVAQLLTRAQTERPTEIILALPPGIDGDMTATYLAGVLDGKVPAITRIARGLPIGSSVEHTDKATLSVAFERRSAE
jgi:recombination protein RecR